MNRDEEYMWLAIERTRQGIASGQTPFGAVIVCEEQVVAAAHNTVWRDTDPTAHAEVNAIRQAARALQRIDLGGCTLFSTCEPCPMCLAAAHWSKIERLVYGATISDAAAAGFSELRVGAAELAKLGKSGLRVESSSLRHQCRTLFDLWKQTGSTKSY